MPFVFILSFWLLIVPAKKIKYRAIWPFIARIRGQPPPPNIEPETARGKGLRLR